MYIAINVVVYNNDVLNHVLKYALLSSITYMLITNTIETFSSFTYIHTNVSLNVFAFNGAFLLILFFTVSISLNLAWPNGFLPWSYAGLCDVLILV